MIQCSYKIQPLFQWFEIQSIDLYLRIITCVVKVVVGEPKKGQFIIDAVLNKTYNLSIDECTYQLYYFNDNVCELSINFYTLWFCGMYCVPFRNQVADRNVNRSQAIFLRKAMHNIDRYFSWIGVVEHYDMSLFQFIAIFDTYTNITLSNFDVANHLNYTQQRKMERVVGGYSHYKLPSKNTIELLHKINDLDMILYEYILHKFRQSVCCDTQLSELSSLVF
eukprot:609696_1